MPSLVPELETALGLDAHRLDGIELSIVMPCLNESETLATCLIKAKSYLEKNNVSGEVVIGDNGSTDGSQEIARSHGVRVVDVPLRGYGAAIHHATLASNGAYIIIGDSDDSYDFTALDPFLAELRSGKDLVMGNRFKGGIKPGAMPWKNRYIGNPILSGIGRLFFGCPAQDFHCGLRGFSRHAYDKLDMRTTGMEYASEMVIKASLIGLSIAEVPTTLSPDGRSRPPHLRPWRDGWRHLIFMLLYSPRWLFLIPGIFTLSAGSLFMGLIWLQPLHLGSVVLDVDSLVFMAFAVAIGYQAILFAVFTKVFATNEGLLPKDPKFDRVFKYINLEVGVAVGVIVMTIGIIGSAFAVLEWSRRGFGELDPASMLRLVIPSGLFLFLGIQTVLSSFFLSMLGLKIRRLDALSSPSELAGKSS